MQISYPKHNLNIYLFQYCLNNSQLLITNQIPNSAFQKYNLSMLSGIMNHSELRINAGMQSSRQIHLPNATQQINVNLFN